MFGWSGVAYFPGFKCDGYSDWEDFISPYTFTYALHGFFIPAFVWFPWLVTFLV